MSKAAERQTLADELMAREHKRHEARVKAIDALPKRLRTLHAVGAVDSKDSALARIAELQCEYIRVESEGRFHDSASREWKRLPLDWRILLLMFSGIGVDKPNLDGLAARNWSEMPPPERDAIRHTVRSAKRHLTGLYALAARV